jgi:predicted RNase H-like HicB family nuclease
LTLKLGDIKTEVIRERDGSYAIACSALGVYSVGKTLREAKSNFEEALDMHLSVLRDKATRQVATVTTHR